MNSLDHRMKEQYENRTRYYLPRRTYTILRIDGKAFHTFTRHLRKPFDQLLIRAMDHAACQLSAEAMGVRLAYGQSDEYSFLLTDFTEITTEAWFDGNVQKMCSVGASVFTQAFNRVMPTDCGAHFDCRVFTIPDQVEVENYFVWRQQDAIRNSILSLGQAHFSAKQLHKANCIEIDRRLQEKGVKWEELPNSERHGRTVVRVPAAEEESRPQWTVDQAIPVFTKERSYLRQFVPDAPR